MNKQPMSPLRAETFDEFQRNVSSYRSGGKLRSVAVFAVWLIGYLGVCLNERFICGDDEAPTIRFFVGGLFAASMILWPMFAIRLYGVRFANRVFNLFR